jgi:hypothetical protein
MPAKGARELCYPSREELKKLNPVAYEKAIQPGFYNFVSIQTHLQPNNGVVEARVQGHLSLPYEVVVQLAKRGVDAVNTCNCKDPSPWCKHGIGTVLEISFTDSADFTTYEVSRVVGHRYAFVPVPARKKTAEKTVGRWEYCVVWLGLARNMHTWEPYEHILDKTLLSKWAKPDDPPPSKLAMASHPVSLPQSGNLEKLPKASVESKEARFPPPFSAFGERVSALAGDLPDSFDDQMGGWLQNYLRLVDELEPAMGKFLMPAAQERALAALPFVYLPKTAVRKPKPDSKKRYYPRLARLVACVLIVAYLFLSRLGRTLAPTAKLRTTRRTPPRSTKQPALRSWERTRLTS